MHDSKKVSDRHWQDFYIPNDHMGNPAAYVASKCPDIEEFDYIIGSDGSGHSDGCGAYAGVIKQLETNDCDMVFGANYGATVQRNELQALLHSMHWVLRKELEYRRERGWGDDDKKEALAYIRSHRPIRLLWYTDRQNLAYALLRGPAGRLVNERSSEKDMWASFRWLESAFLITPYYVPRNTIELQALSDSLCTIGRDTMIMVKKLIAEQTWLTFKEKLPQKALF